MSYRCGNCEEIVARNKPRLLYITYKKVGGLVQIARELPVCEGCKRSLTDNGGETGGKRIKRENKRSGVIKTIPKDQADRIFGVA